MRNNTSRRLDSSEPAVTDVMVAGGLSQLCNIDAPFATLKDMVTRVEVGTRKAASQDHAPQLTSVACGTQIPITHAAPSTYPFPRFPCMGLFLSRSSPARQIFCPSSVSLFDLRARFFVPIHGSLTSSRAGAVKAVAPTLWHAPNLPGHTLTASSTTARWVRSG